MSLRGFVTGGDACTPSDGSGAGPSNAMASLANTLLGGSSKTQEQLREVSCWCCSTHAHRCCSYVVADQAVRAGKPSWASTQPISVPISLLAPMHELLQLFTHTCASPG